MRYSIQKQKLPWGNVVILESPYRFNQLPVFKQRRSSRCIWVTKKYSIYVVLRSVYASSVYPFSIEEDKELLEFLNLIDTCGVEAVFGGDAHITQLPNMARVRVKELIDWVRAREDALVLPPPTDYAANVLLQRKLGAVGLFGLYSTLELPLPLLSLSDLVRRSHENAVAYAEKSGILLRRFPRYLLVAQGHTVDFKTIGRAELTRRNKYPILDALLKLGVITPTKYTKTLRRAQEHPAFELCRRRGFSDGAALYERRLLGSVVDYVAICGTKIGRGVTPRQALLGLGG